MLDLQPIPLTAQDELLFSRPSWADPMFMLRTSNFETVQVNIPALQWVQIVPPDPKRWSIGFADFTGPPNVINVAPYSGHTFTGANVTENFRANWYTIFEFGPIVPAAWYAFSGVPTNIIILYNQIES